MKDIFPPDAVHLDPRTPEAKALDYTHRKYYSGLPAVWLEKPQSQWKLPSQRNQDGSTSCLFQSGATALEVLTKKIESAIFFNERADPTHGGSFLGDVGDILYKPTKGTVLESVCPSQNMNDAQMASVALPPLDVHITGYRIIVDPTNMEFISEAVQAYGNCILVFDSNHDEWQVTPVYLGTPTTFGHAICVVDFTLINGVKYLIARDSAGQSTSPKGYRLLSQDFLNHRCRGAMYLLGIVTKPSVPVPTSPPVPSTAPFLADMSVGQSSLEIGRLQGFLNKLGISNFPLTVDGKYGQATCQVVLTFQEKYVSPTNWWNAFVVAINQGKHCSSLTRQALNKLIGV
jgi:hypothetical protein